MSKSDSELIFRTLKEKQSLENDVEITERYHINETDQESVCGMDNRRKVTSTIGLPYAAICKLYMTAENGNVYIGTAWLTHGNKLYTAGHNLYDDKKKEWMKSITVVPAMSGLTEPYGRYEAAEVMVKKGWMERGSKRFDMGAIKLNTNVSHS